MVTGVAAGLMIAISAFANRKKIEPPVAEIRPTEHRFNGAVRVDPYGWLKEKTDPDVIGYLEKENSYTDSMTAHTRSLRKKLYEEMKRRIREDDRSVPVRLDDYFYYTRFESGLDYPIYCRKQGSLEAEEEILLDVNEVAKYMEYCRIGVFRVSPNHRLLAYSVDDTGDEVYTVYIRDLQTGDLRTDAVPNTNYSVEWANDNETLFYTILDETLRPFKVLTHRLGEDPKQDVEVFHETDDAFFLGLEKSKSRKYLFLYLESQVTSEVRILEADRPDSGFVLFRARTGGVEYALEHHGDYFYVVTNEDAMNFKLMRTLTGEIDPEHWEEVLPHRAEIKLDGVEAFANHLVVYERRNGLKSMTVRNLVNERSQQVEFDEPVYTFSRAGNPEFNTAVLRFTFESLLTPASVYDYNMETGDRVLLKQDEIVGGYNRDDYKSERILAPAKDGTQIPISLVYRRNVNPKGEHPLYLYGYGSYGACIEPGFSSNRLSLLDRGVVCAIAHIRGGGEMGRPWYEEGKLLKKKNTFDDFVASAGFLIREKYTTAQRLVAHGRSAGGLLIGTVLNMRPDLFKAAVADVPFVDIVNTMLDPTIPLTVIEYDEWGNPTDPVFFDYIKSYGPYENVSAQAYPDLLVTAGLNDPRVGYWEPAKWVAKLRATKTDDHLLLLKTNLGTGHFGISGRYGYLEEVAFTYGFILDRLGLG